MFTRTRIRLTAWYVGALALFLLALGTAVYQLEEHQLRTNVDHGLTVTAERVQAKYRSGGFDAPARPTYGPPTRSPGATAPGRPRAAPAPRRTAPSVLAAIAHGSDMRTIERHGVTQRIYSLAADARQLVVQVARSMEPEEDALHGLLRVHAARRRRRASPSRRSAAGSWPASRSPRWPTPFERQQVFVADASHELRTPLAVIRANAEFLQQEQPESEEAAEILAETDRLAALVDSLLALARGAGRRARPTARSTSASS